MGRREADGGDAMNISHHSELGCLQDEVSSGHRPGEESPRLNAPSPCIANERRRNPDMEAMGRTATVTATMEVKKHQHKHNLKHRYEVMATLGKGTYGKVKKAVEKASLRTVAIKSIRKERITDDLDRIHIQREIEITASLRHSNIIRVHEVFESRDKIVMVMEYASRGELYDYIQDRGRLPEIEARRIFRQITSAVHYCHKLADFGLSNHFQRDSVLQTYCGSPLYASPEIVKGLPYQGPEVDCWALGVLLYALVYSSMPFDGASHATLTEQICRGCYHRPNPPSDACALIDWLLTVPVDERATIEDVANHWWVNWGFEESVCDCPSPLHQECSSPLLARYIDWQNQVATNGNNKVNPGCHSPHSSCSHQLSPHLFYFSLPRKSDREGGGVRIHAGMSSLRKSRKENAIPQTALGACGGVCTTTISTASTTERRKPKGILKPQRSFDSVFLSGTMENSTSQSCTTAPQSYRSHTVAHTRSDILSKTLPPLSTFSQPSSKMPKKGILKNLYGGESGYSSSSERRMTAAGFKESDAGDSCSDKQGIRLPAAEDSPTMRTEAVRRRKGILKRNGKFSRSLDLPDDHHSSVCSAPSTFPEALQQLLQATGGAEHRRSRPSSVVSEDSLFSSDSFDLLDLSVQSRRRIFSRRLQHSGCSSEEDLEQMRPGAGGDEEG
ncbi:NUAK family SNF1-like kinase 1 isoform X2 [Antennarius striatus]|uniref:NUAK family SNF1-like kinase 1 isoform X2 n=1 Tax=Antennarius striatus TaxID=241820 RepID=UPI0035AFADF4